VGKSFVWLRSWKLASWRTALVAAVILYGLVGFFVVPVIVKNLIVDIARERTGREVTVGEVRCNPFALSVTVRDFSMPDRPGSVFLSFDEVYVNAQVSSLFRWAATLKELRVDNPYLGLRRFADGGINVIELMDDIEQRTPPEEAVDEAGGLPRALLQHILVSGTAMDVEDLAREQPLRWEFGPSRFELHDISTIPDSQGRNDFIIAMKRGGTIVVDGDVVVEPLGLEGMVVVEDIVLVNLWQALAPFFEFNLTNGRADARFGYSISLAEDGPHAELDGVNLRVGDLEVTAGRNDEPVLRVPRFEIDDGFIAWPEARVKAASILVEGAEALQWIRADGTPSWDALVPEETQEQVVETYRKVEEAFPWDVAVERVEIRGSAARVEDRTFDEPKQLAIEQANVVLTDFQTGQGQAWGLSASGLLLGEAQATAEGTVTTIPWGLTLDVAMAGLDLGLLQRYIERIAPIELGAGVVEAAGTVRVGSAVDGPAAAFDGDLTIHEIDLRETVVGSQVLEWGRVDARGITAGAGPLSLEMEALEIQGAGIEVVVAEDGRINLIEFMAAMAERSRAGGEAEAGEGETAMLPINIGSVTLDSCSAAYTDRTLSPAFSMAVDPVGGTITEVSTTATAGAAIDLEGAVRSGGDLHLEGEMDVFDPKRLTDLAIDIRQADMPPASPMAIRFVGHPLNRGTVDIDLDYRITNSELEGSNRFVTQDLDLGERVEGDRVLDLPVKLGVSLLTDKDGRITLEFPIEGNLDDPSFGLGNAITSAVKEITSELVKSPFRLLGKLGGGSDDEDFGYIEFRAGEAELGGNATDKLATLVAGAEQRPELILLVEGSCDLEADTLALKHAAFETALVTRGIEGELNLDQLESLYLETGSRDALDGLRTGSEGEEGLDETAYYRDLRDAVIEAQVVDPASVKALAVARAEAIRTFIVEHEAGDDSRVRVIDPVEVETSTGGGWVRCRLDVDGRQ
jgi:hypothetical protein